MTSSESTVLQPGVWPESVWRVTLAVGCLPGVECAAVTHAVDDPFVVVWSDPGRWSEIELLEQALLEGPCREAMDTGTAVVAAPPLGTRQTWPGWGAAVERNGVRKVLVLPLLNGNRCRSTLVLLSTAAAYPPVQTVDAAFRLAVHALSRRDE